MFSLKRFVIGFDPVPPAPIPLTKVAFNAVVRDSVASIDVEQTFRNVERNPIECEYVFPILEDAAITNLRVVTDDGKVLTASVEDLEEAKEAYTDAISEGNQAVMGRMETEDRMVLNVGNMAAKSKVVVTFRLVQAIKCEGKEWMFTIPAALLPLFNLSSILDTRDIETYDEDPVPLTFIRPRSCSYHFHFRLTLHSSSPISNIRCPSHSVDITCAAPHLTATVSTTSSSDVVPGRDFRVMYETADAMVPSVKVQYDRATEEYVGMMSFIPPLLDQGEDPEELTGTGEFILVIDRSGSMQGPRIQMACEALLLFVKSLPQPCKFNIISFGSKFVHMFKSSVQYTERSVEKATRDIATFGADMNGTNIYDPMEAILSQPPDPNIPRTVFLLTDGAVSNSDAVVSLVESHSGKARVHVFGIGEGVSSFLVTSVARAGNGVAEFIANPQEIKAKVIGVLQKSMAPALTEGELRWPMQYETQFPPNNKIPTCYFGEVFRVFTHFGTSPPPLGSTLTLIANNSKTSSAVSFDVPIGPDLTEGDEIMMLWARSAIKYKSREYKAGGAESVKSEVVRVSKKYGVPSLYTAFLCVETRADPVTGQMHLRKVPIVSSRTSVPEGSMQFGAMRLFGMKKAPAMSKMLCKSAISKQSSVADECGSSLAIFQQCGMSMKKSSKPMAEASAMRSYRPRSGAKEVAGGSIESSASGRDPVMQLVQTQQIDGHWTMAENKTALQGLPPPEDLLSRLGTEAQDVWATICIVLILIVRFADSEGEWKLVVGKAKRWLKSFGVTDVSTYMDQAAVLLVPS